MKKFFSVIFLTKIMKGLNIAVHWFARPITMGVLTIRWKNAVKKLTVLILSAFPLLAIFFTTGTVASAQSMYNDDNAPALKAGAKSIAVNLSVSIDGQTAQSVSCTQNKTVAVVARATSPDDLSATFVYTFAWRYSNETAWNYLQNQLENSSIMYHIPAIPDNSPSGTFIVFYVGAVGTGNNGSGVSRQYRDIYVNADTVGNIYDVMTSDYSVPDGINSDAQNGADLILDDIQRYIQSINEPDSSQVSYPKPTFLFNLGTSLVPQPIMSFIPFFLLGAFLIWVLRR